LGFAIPVDTAYTVILELIDHGYVKNRPGIDFSVMDVTSIQTAMRYFNSFYTGVYVCEEDHAAVRYGDLILKADGSEISSSKALNQIVMSKSVGDTVDLLVYRNRKKITVTITVSEVIPDALESTS
jgi:serine protease Do